MTSCHSLPRRIKLTPEQFTKHQADHDHSKERKTSEDYGTEKQQGSLEHSPRRGSKGHTSLVSVLPQICTHSNGTKDKMKPSELLPPKSPTPERPKSPNSLAPSMVSSSNGRRKSMGQPDSKLVVLGLPAVGKSAIVVRILTGRFIWEYDPTLEAIYRYNTTVDDEASTIEILDTAGVLDAKLSDSNVRWGEGFLIVYSLSDRQSFLAVPEIHSLIATIKHTPNFPCVLLANKMDLEHSYEVNHTEAKDQASNLGVTLFRASANEGSPSLWEAVSELHREVIRTRGRRRRSSAKVVIEGFYKMFTR